MLLLEKYTRVQLLEANFPVSFQSVVKKCFNATAAELLYVTYSRVCGCLNV